MKILLSPYKGLLAARKANKHIAQGVAQGYKLVVLPDHRLADNNDKQYVYEFQSLLPYRSGKMEMDLNSQDNVYKCSNIRDVDAPVAIYIGTIMVIQVWLGVIFA